MRSAAIPACWQVGRSGKPPAAYGTAAIPPQAAIGQSDNQFTPLQLANYIATLVSGGKHCQAHLLKAAKSYDSSEIIAVGNTQPLSTASFSDSTLQAIKEGMLGYTQPGGMVYSAFKDCIVPAGAKTGTAQLGGGKKNNGMFSLLCPLSSTSRRSPWPLPSSRATPAPRWPPPPWAILNAYFSADTIGTAISRNSSLLP